MAVYKLFPKTPIYGGICLAGLFRFPWSRLVPGACRRLSVCLGTASGTPGDHGQTRAKQPFCSAPSLVGPGSSALPVTSAHRAGCEGWGWPQPCLGRWEPRAPRTCRVLWNLERSCGVGSPDLHLSPWGPPWSPSACRSRWRCRCMTRAVSRCAGTRGLCWSCSQHPVPLPAVRGLCGRRAGGQPVTGFGSRRAMAELCGETREMEGTGDPGQAAARGPREEPAGTFQAP